MKKTVIWISFLLMASAGAVFAQKPNTLSVKEKAEGWQLLFDGKTLQGWHSPVQASTAGTAPAAQPGQIGTSPKPCETAQGKAYPAGAAHWEVVKGELMPCADGIGYLSTDKTYRNFVLSIEFKCAEDVNSGVYFRSPTEAGGYEVQIWKQQAQGYNTGAIVSTAKTAREFKFKAGQWNRYEVTADGDHLVVALNGETTVDIHDARFPEGRFRLQYQNYSIAFRNIKLRPLP